ncbi:hypothetical protein HFO27_13450 [Rhizobium leguminosarum]|uniref:hypothetical protein n=1 Tax=Rhizobium leguminosarum TaxID=384 RepID=UPI001C924D36|nr:hypothetical protein [Rhizobium leguminosarum]MBY3175637.1 hypothetical protein [Rhizobium leguminosarum]
MNIHDAETLEAALAGAPVETRDKVCDLVDAATATYAAAHLAGERRNDAVKALADARSTLARSFSGVDETMTPDGPTFEFRPGRRGATTTEIDPYTARIVKAWQEVQRYNATYDKASAAWHSFAIVSDISGWLANGGRVTRRHAPPVATLTKGQTHATAVAGIREQIEDLANRRSIIEVASAPLADAIAQINADIDRMTQRQAPSLYFSNRGKSPVDVGEVDDTQRGRFIAWALSDLIKAEAAKKLTAAWPDDVQSDDDRAKNLATVEAELLELERLEEAHIVAAAEVGQHIPRRREADMRALLEVK